jgi:hypothetical protein
MNLMWRLLQMFTARTHESFISAGYTATLKRQSGEEAH